MTSFCAKVVKALIRLYTYPYRKRHMSLSRTIRFKDTPYKPPHGYNYAKELYGGIRVERWTPPDCATNKVVVQFHGGGATVGMNDFYRKIARKICDLTHYSVISIDYRIGRDLVHPAMLNDCYGAYTAMLKDGLDSQKVVMIGDSMGANLMLALCFRLRDADLTLPCGLVAVSPYVDMSASGDSYRKNCYTDPSYSLPRNQKYEDWEKEIRRISPYCGTTDKRDPYLSPAFGNYDGFPPTLIQVGTCETSESDSDMLYDKMLHANVPVTLHKYEGMFHDFQYCVPFLRESKQAWKEIQNFICNL